MIVYDRLKQKLESYERYRFTWKEYIALSTFFDLAQEFDRIEDLYNLCVDIPKFFFQKDARLYLIKPSYKAIVLVSATEGSRHALYSAVPEDIVSSQKPYRTNRDSLVLTIRGNKTLMDELPYQLESDVIGFLEIYPVGDLGEHDELFLEKYANRIGFNVHNRFIVEKNIEHLRFIKTLVTDIEHNVIVPNMIYKLFLRHMKERISSSHKVERLLAEYLQRGEMDTEILEDLHAELSDVNEGLREEFGNIEKHYKNMSLFLETLLRRSHFDEGRLVIRRKSCHMKEDIIIPQIERFSERFRQMGIVVDDRFSYVPDEALISVVDVGLMAQVYANLFSNALKYTEEVEMENEGKRKFVTYGYEVMKNFFGDGKDGVKYNVFSTGDHIRVEERENIFKEGVKGSHLPERPGMGHGLAFIKNIVELHGGVVGYEPERYGNNFYFILPVGR